MAEDALPSYRNMIDQAMAGQAHGIKQLHLEGRTRSGRPFKYELTGYRVQPNMSPVAALDLARRIVGDKYRQSDWDRQHPEVDVELELAFVFTQIILGVVGRLNGSSPVKPLWITSWGIDFDGELVEVFPEGCRTVAEERLQALLARDGHRYSLRPLTRIGFPPAATE